MAGLKNCAGLSTHDTTTTTQEEDQWTMISPKKGVKMMPLSSSLSTLTFYIIQIKWMNKEGINSQPVPERKSGRAQERNIDEQKKRSVCTAKSLRLA